MTQYGDAVIPVTVVRWKMISCSFVLCLDAEVSLSRVVPHPCDA
jgi:hypothetical protein